jgi:hypothetical protein
MDLREELEVLYDRYVVRGSGYKLQQDSIVVEHDAPEFLNELEEKYILIPKDKARVVDVKECRIIVEPDRYIEKGIANYCRISRIIIEEVL